MKVLAADMPLKPFLQAYIFSNHLLWLVQVLMIKEWFENFDLEKSPQKQ